MILPVPVRLVPLRLGVVPSFFTSLSSRDGALGLCISSSCFQRTLYPFHSPCVMSFMVGRATPVEVLFFKAYL